MLESKQIKNCLCTVSSHNNAAEKQFRYPVEYGGPRPKTATFTTTGSASAYLTNSKKGIKIESGTIGVVQDLGIKDAYNMGAVMAPAAAYTLNQHLKETKRTSDYYDLILTGDLGEYGKPIFLEYLEKEYGIKLNNYNDTATMIYKVEDQPVFAGGSGPACAPLVTYTFIWNEMQKKNLKKVLLIATGALHCVSVVNEKMTIPSIAHALSLEVIK
jgi:stage V sporulation protein AD